MTVGYSAFYPLPKSFFDDPEAAGKQPVGNGPFEADEPFVPGKGITLTRYDDYAGKDKAKVSSVEYRVYTDVATAYTDVEAGNLDVDAADPGRRRSDRAPAEFGDRYREDPPRRSPTSGSRPTTSASPTSGSARRISMGIDRAAIATAIFNGTRTPATSVVAPTIDGSRANACGYCHLDAAAANTLLDAAHFDRSKPIELWFNAGAGQDAWIEAVGNQLRQNLGVDFVLKGDLGHPRVHAARHEEGVHRPFRSGWTMDYPSPQNYLEPLYSTGALPPGGANLSFYSNPVFDQLVAEGNQAPSNADAIAKYNQAEDVLLEDMPIIPMFFQVEQSVFSEHVSNVKVDIFGRVERRRGHRRRLTTSPSPAAAGDADPSRAGPGGVVSRPARRPSDSGARPAVMGPAIWAELREDTPGIRVPWCGSCGWATGDRSRSQLDDVRGHPSRACLGSTRRIGEVSDSRVRFARDQSVVRQPLAGRGSTCPFPPQKRVEGGIAREVEQAQ